MTIVCSGPQSMRYPVADHWEVKLGWSCYNNDRPIWFMNSSPREWHNTRCFIFKNKEGLPTSNCLFWPRLFYDKQCSSDRVQWLLSNRTALRCMLPVSLIFLTFLNQASVSDDSFVNFTVTGIRVNWQYSFSKHLALKKSWKDDDVPGGSVSFA